MPVQPAEISGRPDAEILIHCPSCHGSITAPAAMAGQTGECPFCHKHLLIEKPPAARDPEEVRRDLGNLEGQLRENVTQITELRGHVSRLNTELHRHQIRMKSLSERQAELQTGIQTARQELGGAPLSA